MTESAKNKGREFVEQIEVAGDQLVGTVKKLVADGKTRKIVVRGEDGHEMLSIPMNFGVAGAGVLALASPVLAAIGAIAALAAKVQLDVVRDDDASGEDTPKTPSEPARGANKPHAQSA